MLLGGCSSVLEGDCISLGRYGIAVDVVDAQTGRAPDSATVLLTERASPDSVERRTAVRSPSTGRLVVYGASERTGSYTVTVSSPGYRDWAVQGVVVTRGGHCDDLRPASLTARLTAAVATWDATAGT